MKTALFRDAVVEALASFSSYESYETNQTGSENEQASRLGNRTNLGQVTWTADATVT